MMQNSSLNRDAPVMGDSHVMFVGGKVGSTGQRAGGFRVRTAGPRRPHNRSKTGYMVRTWKAQLQDAAGACPTRQAGAEGFATVHMMGGTDGRIQGSHPVGAARRNAQQRGTQQRAFLGQQQPRSNRPLSETQPEGSGLSPPSGSYVGGVQSLNHHERGAAPDGARKRDTKVTLKTKPNFQKSTFDYLRKYEGSVLEKVNGSISGPSDGSKKPSSLGSPGNFVLQKNCSKSLVLSRHLAKRKDNWPKDGFEKAIRTTSVQEQKQERQDVPKVGQDQSQMINIGQIITFHTKHRGPRRPGQAHQILTAGPHASDLHANAAAHLRESKETVENQQVTSGLQALHHLRVDADQDPSHRSNMSRSQSKTSGRNLNQQLSPQLASTFNKSFNPTFGAQNFEKLESQESKASKTMDHAQLDTKNGENILGEVDGPGPADSAHRLGAAPRSDANNGEKTRSPVQNENAVGPGSLAKTEGRRAEVVSGEDEREYVERQEAVSAAHRRLQHTFSGGREGLSRHSSRRSVDPDLIKFYAAFQSQESVARLPIRPAGVDFEEDLDKLRQATHGVRQTLQRIEIDMKEKQSSIPQAHQPADGVNKHSLKRSFHAPRAQGLVQERRPGSRHAPNATAAISEDPSQQFASIASAVKQSPHQSKTANPGSTGRRPNDRAPLYDEGRAQSPETNCASGSESWKNLGKSDKDNRSGIDLGMRGRNIGRGPPASGSVPIERIDMEGEALANFTEARPAAVVIERASQDGIRDLVINTELAKDKTPISQETPSSPPKLPPAPELESAIVCEKPPEAEPALQNKGSSHCDENDQADKYEKQSMEQADQGQPEVARDIKEDQEDGSPGLRLEDATTYARSMGKLARKIEHQLDTGGASSSQGDRQAARHSYDKSPATRLAPLIETGCREASEDEDSRGRHQSRLEKRLNAEDQEDLGRRDQSEAAADQRQILNENSQLCLQRSGSRTDFATGQYRISQGRRSSPGALADVGHPDPGDQDGVGGTIHNQPIPAKPIGTHFLLDSDPQNIRRSQDKESEGVPQAMKSGPVFCHDALLLPQNDTVRQPDELYQKGESGDGQSAKITKGFNAKGQWHSAQSIGQDPESRTSGKQNKGGIKPAYEKEKYYRYPNPLATSHRRVMYQTSTRPQHQANMSQGQTTESRPLQGLNFLLSEGGDSAANAAELLAINRLEGELHKTRTNRDLLGAPGGQRPLLVSKAMYSTALQQQALVDLILGSLRVDLDIKQDEMHRLVGQPDEWQWVSQLTEDVNDQHPKPELAGGSDLNFHGSDGETGSIQTQIQRYCSVHNLDPTNCRDVQLALDLAKAQRDNISKPEQIFDNFSNSVKPIIQKAIELEKLQERPQSPGFYTRMRAQTGQPAHTRKKSAKDRMEHQQKLLAAKWQNEEPLKVQVHLAKESGKREASKVAQVTESPPNSKIVGRRQIYSTQTGPDRKHQIMATPDLPERRAIPRRSSDTILDGNLDPRQLDVEIGGQDVRDYADNDRQGNRSRVPGREDSPIKPEVTPWTPNGRLKSQLNVSCTSQKSKQPQRTAKALSALTPNDPPRARQKTTSDLKVTIQSQQVSNSPAMAALDVLNHGIQGQTIVPKQVSGFLCEGLVNSAPQNQRKLRDLNHASPRKGGPVASPDTGAPQRGQATLDASAKSMATVQSDPDGSKFLQTGIYKHNQTNRVSQQSVAHNSRRVASTELAHGGINTEASKDQVQRQMQIPLDDVEKRKLAAGGPTQPQKTAPGPQAPVLGNLDAQSGKIKELDATAEEDTASAEKALAQKLHGGHAAMPNQELRVHDDQVSHAVARPPEGASSNVQEGISQEDGIHQHQTDYQGARTKLLGAEPRIGADRGSPDESSRLDVHNLGTQKETAQHAEQQQAASSTAQDRKSVLTKQLGLEGERDSDHTNHKATVATLRRGSLPDPEQERADKSTQRQLEAVEHDDDGQENLKLDRKPPKLDQIVTSAGRVQREGHGQPRSGPEEPHPADTSKENPDHSSRGRHKVAVKTLLASSMSSHQQPPSPSPLSPDIVATIQPRHTSQPDDRIVQEPPEKAKSPPQRQATRYGYVVPHPSDRPRRKLVPKHTNLLNLEFSRDLPQDLRNQGMPNQGFVIQFDQDRSRLQKLLSSPESLIRSTIANKNHGSKRFWKQPTQPGALNTTQRVRGVISATAGARPDPTNKPNNDKQKSQHNRPAMKSQAANVILAKKSENHQIEIGGATNGQAHRREAGAATRNVSRARSGDTRNDPERQRQMHRNLSRFSNQPSQLLRLLSGVNLTDQNQDTNESVVYQPSATGFQAGMPDSGGHGTHFFSAQGEQSLQGLMNQRSKAWQPPTSIMSAKIKSSLQPIQTQIGQVVEIGQRAKFNASSGAVVDRRADRSLDVCKRGEARTRQVIRPGTSQAETANSATRGLRSMAKSNLRTPNDEQNSLTGQPIRYAQQRPEEQIQDNAAGWDVHILHHLGNATTSNLQDYLQAPNAVMYAAKIGEPSGGQDCLHQGVARDAASLSALVANDGDRAGSTAAAVGLGY